MASVHFVKVDQIGLSFDERNELAKQVEDALAARGLVGDRVIILEGLTWLGSMPSDNEKAL